jgi:hypothetical protein
MEFHIVVAIAIIIALALVMDSTLKLFRFRRKNKITQSPLKFRDISILRRPNDFPVEEARLTYKNWISCTVMLILMVLFLYISPDSLRDVGPPPLAEPPAATTTGATAG